MELFLGTRVEHTEKFSKNRIFLNENAKNHQNLKVKFFGRGCAPQGKEIAQNECLHVSHFDTFKHVFLIRTQFYYLCVAVVRVRGDLKKSENCQKIDFLTWPEKALNDL